MATEMWDAVLFIIALCRNPKRMQLFCWIDFDWGGGGGGGAIGLQYQGREWDVAC